MEMNDKPTGPCDNCQRNGTAPPREASTWWVGDNGAMALYRGMAEQWCELCCVTAQLERARETVARLPELEKRLSELKSNK